MIGDPETSAEKMPQPAAEGSDPTWNILGLKVGRKTEILALVAFVLSVSGVVWQVFNYTRGAVVQLFPTDQLVITATDALNRNYAGQDSLLALIATMAYVNDGDTGHNAIVRREYISLTFGKREIEHRWYEFGSSDVENTNLRFKRDSEARPFPATAASATSHETLFAPWEVDCGQGPPSCAVDGNFVRWTDFIAAMKIEPRITVTTRADLYSSKQVSASCKIRLRDWEIAILEKDKWLSVACVESDTAGRKSRSIAVSGTQR